MTIRTSFIPVVLMLAMLTASVPAGAFSFSGNDKGITVDGESGKVSVDSHGKTSVEPKQVKAPQPERHYQTQRQNVTASRTTQRSNVIVKREGETVLREGENPRKYLGQSGKSPFKGKLKTGGKGSAKSKQYTFNQ